MGKDWYRRQSVVARKSQSELGGSDGEEHMVVDSCVVSVFERLISDVLLVPIGHHLGDGLNYPLNPRFDSAGRWKRRKEWPSDLQ